MINTTYDKKLRQAYNTNPFLFPLSGSLQPFLDSSKLRFSDFVVSSIISNHDSTYYMLLMKLFVWVTEFSSPLLYS